MTDAPKSGDNAGGSGKGSGGGGGDEAARRAAEEAAARKRAAEEAARREAERREAERREAQRKASHNMAWEAFHGPAESTPLRTGPKHGKQAGAHEVIDPKTGNTIRFNDKGKVAEVKSSDHCRTKITYDEKTGKATGIQRLDAHGNEIKPLHEGKIENLKVDPRSGEITVISKPAEKGGAIARYEDHYLPGGDSYSLALDSRGHRFAKDVYKPGSTKPETSYLYRYKDANGKETTDPKKISDSQPVNCLVINKDRNVEGYVQFANAQDVHEQKISGYQKAGDARKQKLEGVARLTPEERAREKIAQYEDPKTHTKFKYDVNGRLTDSETSTGVHTHVEYKEGSDEVSSFKVEKGGKSCFAGPASGDQHITVNQSTGEVVSSLEQKSQDGKILKIENHFSPDGTESSIISDGAGHRLSKQIFEPGEPAPRKIMDLTYNYVDAQGNRVEKIDANTRVVCIQKDGEDRVTHRYDFNNSGAADKWTPKSQSDISYETKTDPETRLTTQEIHSKYYDLEHGKTLVFSRDDTRDTQGNTTSKTDIYQNGQVVEHQESRKEINTATGETTVHSSISQHGKLVQERNCVFDKEGKPVSLTSKEGEHTYEYKFGDDGKLQMENGLPVITRDGKRMSTENLSGEEAAKLKTEMINRAGDASLFMAQTQVQNDVTAYNPREHLQDIGPTNPPPERQGHDANGTLVYLGESGQLQQYKVVGGKVQDDNGKVVGTMDDNGKATINGRLLDILNTEGAAFHGIGSDHQRLDLVSKTDLEASNFNGVLTGPGDKSYTVVGSNVYDPRGNFIGHLGEDGQMHLKGKTNADHTLISATELRGFKFEGTDKGQPRTFIADDSASNGRMFIPDPKTHQPIEYTIKMGMIIRKDGYVDEKGVQHPAGEQFGVLSLDAHDPNNPSGKIITLNPPGEQPLQNYTNAIVNVHMANAPAGDANIQLLCLGPEVDANGRSVNGSGGFLNIQQARENLENSNKQLDANLANQSYWSVWSEDVTGHGGELAQQIERAKNNNYNVEHQLDLLLGGRPLDDSALTALNRKVSDLQSAQIGDPLQLAKHNLDAAPNHLESLPKTPGNLATMQGSLMIPQEHGAQKKVIINNGNLISDDGKGVIGHVNGDGTFTMLGANNQFQTFKMSDIKGAVWHLEYKGDDGSKQNVDWISLGSQKGLVSVNDYKQRAQQEADLANALNAKYPTEQNRKNLEECQHRLEAFNKHLEDIKTKGVASEDDLKFLEDGPCKNVRAKQQLEADDGPKPTVIEKPEFDENTVKTVDGRIRMGTESYLVHEGKLYKPTGPKPEDYDKQNPVGELGPDYTVHFKDGRNINLATEPRVLMDFNITANNETTHHQIIGMGPGRIDSHGHHVAGGLVETQQLIKQADEDRRKAQEGNFDYFKEKSSLLGGIWDLAMANRDAILKNIESNIMEDENNLKKELNRLFTDGFDPRKFDSNRLDGYTHVTQKLMTDIGADSGDTQRLAQEGIQLQHQANDAAVMAVMTVATAGLGSAFAAGTASLRAYQAAMWAKNAVTVGMYTAEIATDATLGAGISYTMRSNAYMSDAEKNRLLLSGAVEGATMALGSIGGKAIEPLLAGGKASAAAQYLMQTRGLTAETAAFLSNGGRFVYKAADAYFQTAGFAVSGHLRELQGDATNLAALQQAWGKVSNQELVFGTLAMGVGGGVARGINTGVERFLSTAARSENTVLKFLSSQISDKGLAVRAIHDSTMAYVNSSVGAIPQAIDEQRQEIAQRYNIAPDEVTFEMMLKNGDFDFGRAAAFMNQSGLEGALTAPIITAISHHPTEWITHKLNEGLPHSQRPPHVTTDVFGTVTHVSGPTGEHTISYQGSGKERFVSQLRGHESTKSKKASGEDIVSPVGPTARTDMSSSDDVSGRTASDVKSPLQIASGAAEAQSKFESDRLRSQNVFWRPPGPGDLGSPFGGESPERTKEKPQSRIEQLMARIRGVADAAHERLRFGRSDAANDESAFGQIAALTPEERLGALGRPIEELQRKLPNLINKVGINWGSDGLPGLWDRGGRQAEKLLRYIDRDPLYVFEGKNGPVIRDGNTRYLLAARLGIPDTEIRVRRDDAGGGSMSMAEFRQQIIENKQREGAASQIPSEITQLSADNQYAGRRSEVAVPREDEATGRQMLQQLGMGDVPHIRPSQFGDHICTYKVHGVEYFMYQRMGQSWWSGRAGELKNEPTPVKIHIMTDSPTDLATLQRILIPELSNPNSEIHKIIGEWKTFDPRSPSGLFDNVRTADGAGQNAKAFTIEVPPQHLQAVARAIDSLLMQHEHELSLGKDVHRGSVDIVQGRSRRVTLSRDYYPATFDSSGRDGFRVDPELQSLVARDPAFHRLLDSHGIALHQLNDPEFRAAERNLERIQALLDDYGALSGIQRGLLSLDTSGFLMVRRTTYSASDKRVGLHADESRANKVWGEYNDRVALHALAGRFGIDQVSLALRNTAGGSAEGFAPLDPVLPSSIKLREFTSDNGRTAEFLDGSRVTTSSNGTSLSFTDPWESNRGTVEYRAGMGDSMPVAKAKVKYRDGSVLASDDGLNWRYIRPGSNSYEAFHVVSSGVTADGTIILQHADGTTSQHFRDGRISALGTGGLSEAPPDIFRPAVESSQSPHLSLPPHSEPRQAELSEPAEPAGKAMEMPRPERERLKQLLATASLDPVGKSRAANLLQKFEQRSDLSESETGRTMHSLAEFLSRQGGPDSLVRAHLLVEILQNISEPASITQGQHKTCNVTTQEVAMCMREPSQYVRFLSDIITTGKFVTDDGSVIEVPLEQLNRDCEARKHLYASSWRMIPVPGPAGAMLEHQAHQLFPLMMVDPERNGASQIFQIAAVNVFVQRRGVLNGESGTFERGSGQFLYKQVPPDPSIPGDTGERLVHINTQGVESLIARNPSFQGAEGLSDVYAQITGQNDRTIMTSRDGLTNNPGAQAPNSVEHMQQLITEEMEKSRREGKPFCLALVVNTLNEPFFTDSGAGRAGGSGGSHIINIVGMREDPQHPGEYLLELDNSWYRSAEHMGENALPARQVFWSMQRPGSPGLLSLMREHLNSHPEDHLARLELLRHELIRSHERIGFFLNHPDQQPTQNEPFFNSQTRTIDYLLFREQLNILVREFQAQTHNEKESQRFVEMVNNLHAYVSQLEYRSAAENQIASDYYGRLSRVWEQMVSPEGLANLQTYYPESARYISELMSSYRRQILSTTGYVPPAGRQFLEAAESVLRHINSQLAEPATGHGQQNQSEPVEAIPAANRQDPHESPGEYIEALPASSGGARSKNNAALEINGKRLEAGQTISIEDSEKTYAHLKLDEYGKLFVASMPGEHVWVNYEEIPASERAENLSWHEISPTDTLIAANSEINIAFATMRNENDSYSVPQTVEQLTERLRHSRARLLSGEVVTSSGAADQGGYSTIHHGVIELPTAEKEEVVVQFDPADATSGKTTAAQRMSKEAPSQEVSAHLFGKSATSVERSVLHPLTGERVNARVQQDAGRPLRSYVQEEAWNLFGKATNDEVLKIIERNPQLKQQLMEALIEFAIKGNRDNTEENIGVRIEDGMPILRTFDDDLAFDQNQPESHRKEPVWEYASHKDIMNEVMEAWAGKNMPDYMVERIESFVNFLSTPAGFEQFRKAGLSADQIEDMRSRARWFVEQKTLPRFETRAEYEARKLSEPGDRSPASALAPQDIPSRQPRELTGSSIEEDPQSKH